MFKIARNMEIETAAAGLPYPVTPDTTVRPSGARSPAGRVPDARGADAVDLGSSARRVKDGKPPKVKFSAKIREVFENYAPLPVKPACPEARVTAEEFMGRMLANHAQITSIRPSWVTVHDGVTEPIRKWFTENAKRVAKRVPLRTTNFELTPGQVSIVYYLAYGPPVPISFGYSINIEEAARCFPEDNPHRKRLLNLKDTAFTFSFDPGNAYSGTRIACMPTGNGKTVVTLAAVFANLLTPKENDRAKSMYAAAMYGASTGLRFETTSDLRKTGQTLIAPLVVVLCPPSMESHWHMTALSLCKEVERIHAAGKFTHDAVRVWVGRPAREGYSVEKALSENAPTLWILTHAANSLHVLHDHPDIGIRGLVIDELVRDARTRRVLPSSPVCGPHIVVQATVESLGGSHTLRTRLGGEVLIKNEHLDDETFKWGAFGQTCASLKQAAKVPLCMVPDILTQVCARGSVALMPKELVVYTVVPTHASLGEMLAHGELGDHDIAELLKAWLQKTVRRARSSASIQDWSFVEKSEDKSVIVDYARMMEVARDAVVVEDAYEVLGLVKDAMLSGPELDKMVADARKRLRFKWHPDKNPGNEERSCEMFSKITAAAEKLLNARARARHEDEVAQNESRLALIQQRMAMLAAHFQCTDPSCDGKKMRFMLSEKICMTCGTGQPSNKDLCLEGLHPGVTRVATKASTVLKRVLEMCVKECKRIVFYCTQFNESVFDGLGCELLTLAQIFSESEGSNKRKNRLNKNKRADMVQRFNEPARKKDLPLVIALGKEELCAIDLKTVESIVVYGSLSQEQQWQLQGRTLRNGTANHGRVVKCYFIQSGI